MARGSKYFLFSLLAALGSWLLGVYLVGVADFRHFTARGNVDMSDPVAIQAALSDPTFSAELSWGSIKLVGLYWSFAFPLALAALAFLMVVLIAMFRKGQRAPK